MHCNVFVALHIKILVKIAWCGVKLAT